MILHFPQMLPFQALTLIYLLWISLPKSHHAGLASFRRIHNAQAYQANNQATY